MSDEKQEWICPHGVTYTGSDDFISGARMAHDEIENRANAALAADTEPDPKEDDLDAWFPLNPPVAEPEGNG